MGQSLGVSNEKSILWLFNELLTQTQGMAAFILFGEISNCVRKSHFLELRPVKTIVMNELRPVEKIVMFELRPADEIVIHGLRPINQWWNEDAHLMISGGWGTWYVEHGRCYFFLMYNTSVGVRLLSASASSSIFNNFEGRSLISSFAFRFTALLTRWRFRVVVRQLTGWTLHFTNMIKRCPLEHLFLGSQRTF